MDNYAKLLLVTLCGVISSCNVNTAPKYSLSQPVLADIAAHDSGLVTVSSPYDVEETSDRLEDIIIEKGLTLFARIDHASNAVKVDLELPPTQLLILGNPKVGTPLMQCASTTAIDLPQKILVYQDDNNQTQIVYNQPEYLKQRHHIEGCDEILEKVTQALNGITQAAVE